METRLTCNPYTNLRMVAALKPHPKNAAIYGDGPDADLVESVRAKGILEHLIVTPDDVIVSGHRRWLAAKAAGLEAVPVVILKAKDDLDVLEALVHANKARAKTNEQLGREAALLLEVERERAKRRQQEAGGRGGKASGAARRGEPNVVEPVPPPSADGEQKPAGKPAKGKARDKVGAALGVSGKTAQKAAEVVQAVDRLRGEGNGEEAERLRGTLNRDGVGAAHKAVKPSRQQAQAIDTKEGAQAETRKRWLGELAKLVDWVERYYASVGDDYLLWYMEPDAPGTFDHDVTADRLARVAAQMQRGVRVIFGGDASNAAPEPAMTPADGHWHRAMRELWAMLNEFRDLGGIQVVSTKWDGLERTRTRTEIRHIIRQLSDWVVALGGSPYEPVSPSRQRRRGTGPPKPGDPHPHSEGLRWWLEAVASQTHIINVEQGGIKQILAEAEKWDEEMVLNFILPMLRALARTIEEFRREIAQADWVTLAAVQRPRAKPFTQEEIGALPNPGILVNNHESVQDLQRAVINAPRDLQILGGTLLDVLRTGAWMDRLDPHRGDRFRYQSAGQFLDFIRDPLPEGLDTTPEMLRRLLADDPEVLALFEAALPPEVRAEAAEKPAAAIPQPTSACRSFTEVIAPILDELDHWGGQNEWTPTPGQLHSLAERLRHADEPGIIRVPTPLEKARRAVARLSDADAAALVAWVQAGRPGEGQEG